MKVSDRNYGLDLLRIILAFMVLTLHFNAGGTGKVLMNSSVLPWKYMTGVITTLCYPAVNCYILISSYFLFKQNVNIKKQAKNLLKLWTTIIFYSLAGYMFVVLVYDVNFSFSELLLRLFPISRGKWWFFTVYFAITILAPFINIMLKNIDKKMWRILLILMLLMCSIIPMFNNWRGQLGSNNGYSLLWFFCLYITGAYIAEYIDPWIKNKQNEKGFVYYCIILYFILTIGVFCLEPILKRIGMNISFTPYNSLFIYIQSIVLFLIFNNISMAVPENWRKIIVKVSAASLAVYMIHCQEDIENVLWENLKPWRYANDYRIIIVYFVFTLLFYTVCIIIETVRKRMFVRLHTEENILKLGDIFFEKVKYYL